jgi:YD repeat-containing protein
MKKFKLLARLLLVMCLIPWPAKAQTRKIVCDVDCGTDPNSTGFSGIVAARASIPNQRGGGHPLAVMPRMPILVRNVEGSQSYDYSVNLLSLTGRNGSNLNLSLSYNSRVWTRGTTGISLNADLDNPSYGFRGVDFGFIQANSTSSDYILTRKNGSKSELFLVSGNLYQSHDSTYVQFDATTNVWKLTAKDGTQTFYTPFGDGTILRPITIENSNGNKISIAYVNTSNLAISTITDTLGRVVTFTYDAAGKLTTISQGSKTVTFNWNTAYLLAYNFSLPIVGSAANGSTQTVLSGVTFADHTSVNFFYGDWAIVNRIERRSASGALRASVSYNFPAAVSGALNDAPAFTQQTMFDGVNTGVWNYASATNASGLVTSFAVTDPSGTKTTSTFSSNGDWRDGLQLTEQTKDATGKQWRLKVRTWTADNLTTGANPHPSLITAQVDDGTQSQVAFAYDANGNITDVKEYDFGPAGPGALLRETVTSYASLGSNIMDRPSQVLIKDGAGNIVARTDFNYDQYASVPLKGVTPAAAQHDDVNYSTSPTASRGNLTTKTVYTNAAAGSGAITSTFTYDVLGNRVLAVDGCCTQASSSYSAATQYAFPDSVSIGPSGNQLTASFAYNFNTGTVATATDANGQLTTFTYDLNDRVASVHTPDNVTTSTNFDDSSANPGWSSSNTANSEVTAVTTDFAGHALSQQVRNGLSLIGTITSGRDVLGRLVQKTNPYGPGDAAAYTTFGYDAIGREIQSTPPALVSGVTQASFQTAFSGHTAVHSDPAGKQRKEYYNALGQLVQVDEPGDPFTGAFASGTLTIGGTLASQSGVGSTPAVKAAGNVNITGASSAPITICNPDITPRVGHPCSTITVSDRGTVTITVNGHSTSASYGASMSSTTIAGRLASAINLDTAAFVTASSSGSTLSLQSIAAGPSSNYGWNISSQSTDPTGTFGPGPGPFSASPASGTLAGGAAGNPGTTVPDKGTVTLSVGGLAATANYGSDPGLDNSAAAVAADLVTKIKAQLSPTNPAFAISVPQNGTQISFNWSSVGAAGNVSVSVVSTTTQTLFAFPAPSFTACASSGNPISCPSALVGGQDPAPSSLANPNTTQYAYSALGQLTQVTQGQQVRRFGYDSLGRLTSQSMPEKGNLSDTFTYTDFGGIAIRTDARGITATYSYDLLNRVSKIVYSDGTPTVTYAYGATGAANFAAGRLVTATDGAGSETYQYDMLGRVVKCTRVIGVNTYITSYAYTPDGRLSSTTYPSGRIVSNQSTQSDDLRK